MTKTIDERSEEQKRKIALETIELLNELLELDHDAIEDLLGHRTRCSHGLAWHNTVQVEEAEGTPPTHTVGMLGILNGLVGIRKDRWGYITAVFDDETKKLLRFQLTKRDGDPVSEVPKEVGPGWGYPLMASKMHYFGADCRALCGKWAYSGERIPINQRGAPLASQCKDCFRRLAKMKVPDANPVG